MNEEVFAGYRLEERIGIGGMAEVFRASRLGPGGFAMQVALKRVLPDLARDPRFVAMFLEEARLAAHLTAPGLVQVFDFGQADGGYFLVMEYVEGTDLGALLARSGRLPPALAVYLGRQLCAALAALHQARDASSGEPLGVVHRDVSPGNILLSVGGDVKLGDFGVAKARARSVRTERGSLKGKLGYMSPEQVRGDEVDGRADVYGLGLVLFEALTGERYLTARDGGGEAELLRAAERPIFRAPSSLCPGLPAALDRALARALATEPQRRFPNATFFDEALAACAPGLDLSASRRELGLLVRAACPGTAAAPAERRTGEEVDDTTASVTTGSDARPAHSVAEPAEVGAPGHRPDGHRTEVLAGALGSSRRGNAAGKRAGRSWRLWLPIAVTVVVGAALGASRLGVWTALRPSPVEPAARDNVSWPEAPVAIVAPSAPPASPGMMAPPLGGTEAPAPEEPGARVPPGPPAEATAVAGSTKPRARSRALAAATEAPALPSATRSASGSGASRAAAPAQAAAAPLPEPVPTPKPEPSSATTLAADDARRMLDEIARALERRGVLRADAPELYRAQSALMAGATEPGVRAAEVQRLQSRVSGLVVDRAFIDAKLQRLDRALANRELPAEVRQDLRRHSQKALSDSVSGRYDDANRELNEIARIVER